ncbi:MAG: hypothetical protein JJT82_09670 [Legionellaceae bacterium]|nr:hypothetical protein [Legionellaceae bacterium]
MKLPLLYSLLLIWSWSMSVFSLSMGELQIDSYLNQPFRGEIVLGDLADIPPEGIKVRLASYDDFERMGFEYQEVLTVFQFKIKKNNKGKTVIAIHSDERISEPYIELVMDVAWADGQLYRAYTILLDPPHYTLARKTQPHTVLPAPQTGHRGVVDRPVLEDIVVQASARDSERSESYYGPTTGKETIWAIAQRYSESGASLSQIALAIVGANPQAFNEGNLNALLAGKRLRIPASEEIRNIPAELARAEVVAHDKAWADNTTIVHVLQPPYFSGIEAHTLKEPELEFLLPASLPVVEALHATDDSAQRSGAQGNPDALGTLGSENIGLSELPSLRISRPAADIRLEEASVIVPAPVLVRAQRSLPNETWSQTIIQLQKDKEHLEQQLLQRDRELSALRQQVNELTARRDGIAAQSGTLVEESGSWYFILLFAALLAAVVIALLYFYIHRAKMTGQGSKPSLADVEPDAPLPEERTDAEQQADATPDISTDFDAGASGESMAAMLEHEIENVQGEVLSPARFEEGQEKNALIKSKVALDTLLSLAKTYIGMGDGEAARQSLQEVLEYGDETQQVEARKLLEQLDNQS